MFHFQKKGYNILLDYPDHSNPNKVFLYNGSDSDPIYENVYQEEGFKELGIDLNKISIVTIFGQKQQILYFSQQITNSKLKDNFEPNYNYDQKISLFKI